MAIIELDNGDVVDTRFIIDIAAFEEYLWFEIIFSHDKNTTDKDKFIKARHHFKNLQTLESSMSKLKKIIFSK